LTACALLVLGAALSSILTLAVTLGAAVAAAGLRVDAAVAAQHQPLVAFLLAFAIGADLILGALLSGPITLAVTPGAAVVTADAWVDADTIALQLAGTVLPAISIFAVLSIGADRCLTGIHRTLPADRIA